MLEFINLEFNLFQVSFAEPVCLEEVSINQYRNIETF